MFVYTGVFPVHCCLSSSTIHRCFIFFLVSWRFAITNIVRVSTYSHYSLRGCFQKFKFIFCIILLERKVIIFIKISLR